MSEDEATEPLHELQSDKAAPNAALALLGTRRAGSPAGLQHRMGDARVGAGLAVKDVSGWWPKGWQWPAPEVTMDAEILRCPSVQEASEGRNVAPPSVETTIRSAVAAQIQGFPSAPFTAAIAWTSP